ncbi:hypothetical protein H0H92_005339, partial [Tricholoma furcatifolium]
FIHDAIGYREGQVIQGADSSLDPVVIHRTTVSTRNIFLVYAKDENLVGSLRQIYHWISHSCRRKRRFSGLIYLEDLSTPPPISLSTEVIRLLDQCVDHENITALSIGWSDDNDERLLEDRHQALIRQWRHSKHPDSRKVDVFRLSAPDKTTIDVYKTPSDIVDDIVIKAGHK